MAKTQPSKFKMKQGHKSVKFNKKPQHQDPNSITFCDSVSSQMYTPSLVSIYATKNGTVEESSLPRALIEDPHNKTALHSRNCFVTTQNPKQTWLKSYNRIRNKGINQFLFNKHSNYPTSSQNGQKADRPQKDLRPKNLK